MAYTQPDQHTETVKLWLNPPAFPTELSAKPTASSVARSQAAGGKTVVTSLIHEKIDLQPLGAKLLHLLDGTRDRKKLLKALCSAVENKEVVLPSTEYPLTDRVQLRNYLASFIDGRLYRFGRLGLLTG